MTDETDQQMTGSAPDQVPAASGPTIVGIGASAGGLEAFSELLTDLPATTGMAFVFVQHLSPDHESMLSELLQKATSIPVEQATDGLVPQADHVYVIPPDVMMTLDHGQLRLRQRVHSEHRNLPVDAFFQSLAHERGNRAIGVLLSGTGSDGTAGLQDIRVAGGVTIVQTAESARYDGMANAAIAADVVDLVLAPAAIASELDRLGSHPYLDQPEPNDETPIASDDQRVMRVVQLIRQHTGVDFSGYKSGTFKRRLYRRMMLQRLESLERYLHYLENNPEEIQRLYQDILIHVTRFFRSARAFDALRDHVLPELLAARTAERPLRIWVPGCASGEEAYSLAITVLEFLGDRAADVPIQIFATDIADHAIDQARTGVYGEEIAADVSPERLQRFFTRHEFGYRVSQPVRELCIFSRQDLTRDPPFSQINLIACRNVLIYMGAELQQRLLRLFHYALTANGFLMLGESETVDQQPTLFAALDKRNGIYTRKQVEAYPRDAFPTPVPEFHRRGVRSHRETLDTDQGGARRESEQYILRRYAPPSVLVDENNRVLFVRGSTGAWLEPPQGEPDTDLFRMARTGLINGLRTGLREARESGQRTRVDRINAYAETDANQVSIEVVPVGSSAEGQAYLIIFEPEAAAPAAATARPERNRSDLPAPDGDAKDLRIQDLETELDSMRDHLHSVTQDYEASNEELQTASEEVLSSNEELQSTNEELDTAREELQATNEELNSLNDELHGRNDELRRANDDLVNLLASIDVGIIIVDHDMRVRRFTPVGGQLMNLIDTDIGRPIGQINPLIDLKNVEQRARRAILEQDPVVTEVRDQAGRWYRLVIRAYRNTEQRVDGAVISLYEITDLKEQDWARRYAEEIIEAVHEPLLVVDAGLRIKTVNGAFRRLFAVEPGEVYGRRLAEISTGRWDHAALHELLDAVIASGKVVEDHDIATRLPALGERTMRLNARRLGAAEDRESMIVLAFEDVTDRDDGTG